VSVCLSHAGIVSKLLTLELHEQCHNIAQGLCFFGANNLDEIRTAMVEWT